jgi:glycosyltransferase involved in cell wall biosynthesis
VELVTVGIPIYNAEAYLADAIRSVFAQTHTAWELLLVDDGSTDGSLEIARSVRDPRVRVLSDGKNVRLPARLNQITAEASGTVVARMDADDLMSPRRLATQLDVLRARPDIDLVTTAVCSVTNDLRPAGVRGGAPERPITGRTLLQGRAGIVHAALVGRREWFIRNPYDARIDRTEDYELWLRAFGKKDFNVVILDDPLYYYREEQNVTPSRLLKAYASQRSLYRTYRHLGFSASALAMAVSRSHAQSLVVRALGVLGRTDLLLRRRNARINDPAAAAMFAEEIARIRSTPVPGLE